MRRLFCVFLCICLFGATVSPAYAGSVPEVRETMDDGSYFVTVISDDPPPLYGGEIADEAGGIMAFINQMLRFLRQLIELLTGTRTVSKTKYVNYYDSLGTLLWTVALTAEFTYNKNQATCTSASARHSVYDKDWGVVRARAEKVGHTAAGYFSVQQVKLGVKLKTIDRMITMACDTNGNVY